MEDDAKKNWLKLYFEGGALIRALATAVASETWGRWSGPSSALDRRVTTHSDALRWLGAGIHVAVDQ